MFNLYAAIEQFHPMQFVGVPFVYWTAIRLFSISLALIAFFRRSTAPFQSIRLIDFAIFFQTVLENNTTSAGDDEFELWDQNQMLRAENDDK